MADLKFLLSTQIAYHLTLTATVRDGPAFYAVSIPICQLTGLVFALLRLTWLASAVRYELAAMAANWKEWLASVASKLLVYVTIADIISRSLAFGLGIGS